MSDFKIRKISKNWYRIALRKDKCDITVDVVDIIKTRFGEWSVCEGFDLDCGEQVTDKRRYEFTYLRTAKLFAQDLAVLR